jgi:FKBP-type peptidyl-prolyl cis-trans isomerase
MNKQKGIVVTIAVVVVFLLVGGTALWNNFTNNNQNQNQMSQDNNQTQTSPEQIQIKDIAVGSGDIAVAGKEVTVNYTGVFADGKKFDSSLDRGVPFTFKLGSGMVIKGWDIGIEGMKVGGKRILVIPPNLGYGSEAYGQIPASSTLIFQVELLGVK